MRLVWVKIIQKKRVPLSTKRIYSKRKKLTTIFGIEPKILIKDGQKVHIIQPNDIIWILTEGNYSTIKTITKKILIKKSLAKISSELPTDTLFKSHRSAMILIPKIDSLDIKANMVIMKDGESIPLSKNYRSELSKILEEHYQNLS